MSDSTTKHLNEESQMSHGTTQQSKGKRRHRGPQRGTALAGVLWAMLLVLTAAAGCPAGQRHNAQWPGSTKSAGHETNGVRPDRSKHLSAKAAPPASQPAGPRHSALPKAQRHRSIATGSRLASTTGGFCSPDGWCWENPLPHGCRLFSVWGTSGKDVFAVGDSGTILHFDGRTWSAVKSGTTRWLYSVWGAGPANVFAVGDHGTILHYNGKSWAPMKSGTTESLYSVWGTGPTNVFAVGSHGTILHYDGRAWASMISGTRLDLFSVWGSSSKDVFAVGAEGTIIHFDGRAWAPMKSGAPYGLNSVWGTGPTNIFAVGLHGTILHPDSSAWSSLSLRTTAWLRSVWGASATSVFAVGDHGTILHYRGPRSRH